MGAMDAYEVRLERDYGHSIIGLDTTKEKEWEPAIKNDNGWNSCMVDCVNDAVIFTFFKESLAEAKDLWETDCLVPVAQAFTYDDKSPTLWSFDPKIQMVLDGLTYRFYYNERVKIDNVKYDNAYTYLRLHSAIEGALSPVAYGLVKYKD